MLSVLHTLNLLSQCLEQFRRRISLPPLTDRPDKGTSQFLSTNTSGRFINKVYWGGFERLNLIGFHRRVTVTASSTVVADPSLIANGVYGSVILSRYRLRDSRSRAFSCSSGYALSARLRRLSAKSAHPSTYTFVLLYDIQLYTVLAY